MKGILIVFAIAALFVLYLVLHRYSIIYTQEISRLETELKLCKDEVLNLEAQKHRVFLFANLEKLALALGLTYPKTTAITNEKNQLSAEKKLTNPVVEHE